MKKLPILLVFSIIFFLSFQYNVFASEQKPAQLNGFEYTVRFSEYNHWVGSDKPITVQPDFAIFVDPSANSVAFNGASSTLGSIGSTGQVKLTYGNITFASHDILAKGTSNVFFSVKTDFLKTVEKIPILTQILLPIRGILPYLIPFVVLLVAFWKGWQFLLQQLRTA